ncbi:MAG TPA: pyruvate dehydrogenase complex dihydrolipoamide acetyltransferase [Alphaproteobacteria bacterium]|nr:pyruvate dehydrogenase complex dihydrolipoamide acetyltransferase [Alphaproteobacteria bacterium]
MPVTVRMPALSPTMTEGKIAQWLKKEGDEVRSGDLLAEIETDKATMEVEATDEGTLGKILADEGGDMIAVNAPIAVIMEEGEDKSALEEAVKAAEAEAKSAPEPKEEKSGEEGEAPEAKGKDKEKDKEKSEEKSEEEAKPAKDEAPAPKQAAPSPAPKPAPPATGPASGRIIASPLARRMAKTEGIDLGRVQGTGPHGRIVKADVEAAIATGGARATGGIFAGLGQSFGEARARVEPHSSMRKVIAQRLTESKQTVPHFYASIDCDIDALLSLRKEINATDEALNVSVNDFIVRAVALALGEVPAANASWSEEGMNFYSSADVSVAVATEGGLITPIVRSAEKKGVAAISLEVRDLADRARKGKLKPEEYQGGTFTISNMGMMGVRDFAAVINPPQACILAIGAGEERVVVREGEIATATLMTCTISCDHRAVDGAVGAQFLAAYKELIEHPVRLIL